MSTTNETTEVDTLFDQSLKLTPEQRLELCERLLLSVPAPIAERIGEEWDKEIERRVKEFEGNPMIGIPAEQVMAKAKAIANEGD